MTDNQTNSRSLTIFEPRNVRTLAELAPQSYQDNLLSHTRCLEAGNQLLARVKQEGMSDTLDMDIARFIEKAKVTVRKMNGKRTPVTQLFDQIRKVYTSLENDIDPTKTDSIPNQLQAYRNDYARRKQEEEERRRRDEAMRQAKENARQRYRTDVETDYLSQLNALINTAVNELNDLDRSINLDNLDNFAAVADSIKAFNCELSDEWCATCASTAHRPPQLTPDECRAIQAAVMSSLAPSLKEKYLLELQDTRQTILDRLPSKKTELQRIAKASAQEAQRIKAEMEQRERAEAERKEAELRERQQQEAAQKQLQSQRQEMDSLFGMPATPTAAYIPKTQVKKKAVVSNPDDVMKIVSFWWSQEGCRRSLEDLCKDFRKQINFANAAANSKDNPMFITGLQYADEIKAK